jgi:hypothetical protein
MQLVLELGVADLAGTRFAVSPLHETLRALPLLAKPGRSPVNRPWARWARAELDGRPLRMPGVWPLIVTDLPRRRVLYRASELGLALLDQALHKPGS